MEREKTRSSKSNSSSCSEITMADLGKAMVFIEGRIFWG